MNRILFVMIILCVGIHARVRRNVNFINADLGEEISASNEDNEELESDNLNEEDDSSLSSDGDSEIFDESSNQDDELNKRNERSNIGIDIASHKHILDYLITILNQKLKDHGDGNKSGNNLENEESSRSGSSEDLVEDPSSGLLNHGVVYLGQNRKFMTYGPMVDIKARSGTQIGEDSTNSARNIYYHPQTSRRGMFFNPGVYAPWRNLPPSSPVTFTKIDGRHIFNGLYNRPPINNLYPMLSSNIPLQVQSRRLETDKEILNKIDPEIEKPDLDMEANAYAYEP